MALVAIIVTSVIPSACPGDPPAAQDQAATQGFEGVLDLVSVSVTKRKIVFVVTGPCKLLLGKMPDASGNAQVIDAVANHTVIVWYRTGAAFPTDAQWEAECTRVESLLGKGTQFQATGEQLTWQDGDLTLVTTQILKVEKIHQN
ncbi:MAG TPA: hypothetical protein VG733_16965 [Chthoniobacteraceae bacterium]|nr:hypothetical protein [Chthoniobacteraceae bacterium]